MPRSACLLFILVVLLAACNMPAPTQNASAIAETPLSLVVSPESPVEETAPPQTEEQAAEPTVEASEAPATLPPEVLSATLTISDTALLSTGLPQDWAPLATLQAAPSSLVAQISDQRFWVQSGSPAALPNFAHPEAECNWMGVAGQVFLADGTPAIGLVVEVRGTLQGQNAMFLAITGGAKAYGPGGYEIRLANQPVGATLTFRLFNVDGEPLSSPMLFQTSNSCDENLIVLNLVEQPKGMDEAYLPLVDR